MSNNVPRGAVLMFEGGKQEQQYDTDRDIEFQQVVVTELSFIALCFSFNSFYDSYFWDFGNLPLGQNCGKVGAWLGQKLK